MENNSARERISALKQRVQNSADLQSEIADLKDILASDCAELDKAQVAWCVGEQFEACLRNGIKLLREALSALEAGDTEKAINLFQDYYRLG